MTGTSCRRKSRFSSTIRTRGGDSGNDADLDGRFTHLNGSRPGVLRRVVLPIPAIRCCQKHWKNGRSTCLAACLPRHLEIIYEINRRFLEEVASAFPG